MQSVSESRPCIAYGPDTTRTVGHEFATSRQGAATPKCIAPLENGALFDISHPDLVRGRLHAQGYNQSVMGSGQVGEGVGRWCSDFSLGRSD
jgi:hypothetical protein